MSEENQLEENGSFEETAPISDTAGPGDALPAVEKEPSRFAKFMQTFLRWSVLILGVFAIGMLVSYILFGAPLARQLKEATATIESQNQSLDEANDTMTALRADLDGEKELRLQAELALDEVEGRYEAMAVIRYVQQAQVALLQEDNTAVKAALGNAEAEFEKLDLYLTSKDPDLADTILSRLALVGKEYISDPVTASQDMVILLDRLLEAEALFEK